MKKEKKEKETLNSKLNGWGGGLIIAGILHFVLAPFLWAEWGAVLAVIGVLCYLVKHRAMFIILGLALMLIGLLNGYGGLSTGKMFWAIFGGFQVFWGIEEICNFWKYAEKMEQSQYNPDMIADKPLSR